MFMFVSVVDTEFIFYFKYPNPTIWRININICRYSYLIYFNVIYLHLVQ